MLFYGAVDHWKAVIVRLAKDWKSHHTKSGWGMGVLACKREELRRPRSPHVYNDIEKVCVAQWDKIRMCE